MADVIATKVFTLSPEMLEAMQRLAHKWQVDPNEILNRGVAVITMIDELYTDGLGNVILEPGRKSGNCKELCRFNLKAWSELATKKII